MICYSSDMRVLVYTILVSLLLQTGCIITETGRRISAPRRPEDRRQVMEVTGYCDCQKCCSWEYSWFGLGGPVYSSGPHKGEYKAIGVTSSGVATRKGTIAGDPRYFPYGTVFYVPGYGYGVMEDTGGAIKGGRLDLWFPTHEDALKWGRRKKVDVKIWDVKRKKK